MDRYWVHGGRPLVGAVRAAAAKNAVLPLLAATVLADEPTTLVDVPELTDVDVMAAILRNLGARVEPGEAGGLRCLTVDPRGGRGIEVPEDLMRRMRSSVLMMGPLLARWGRCRLSYPGGCVIGPRPIDLHLRGLQAMGARITQVGGVLTLTADRLHGAEIVLDRPSVGATENLLMAAVYAQGTTVITNAAREPELEDLQALLNAMGARVSGAGTSTVTIVGPPRGGLGGAAHTVIPDRIEAGTFLIAAAATGGRVTVENAVPGHLAALLGKLHQAGCGVEVGERRLTVAADGRLAAVDLATEPYPGFPTDLQNPMMALLLRARGTSTVVETVFENRFRVASEFLRLGARVELHGRMAVVHGVERLSGAPLEAGEDLRGAAALLLAALGAEGPSCIERADCIRRGYQRLDERLRALGADVRREPE